MTLDLHDVLGGYWSILPGGLESVLDTASNLDLAAAIPRGSQSRALRPQHYGKSAIIAVRGPITQRSTWVTEILGGSSLSSLTLQVREALNDRDVENIVLDIHSPGGSVYGLQEFGETLYKARSVKPIVAVANSLAASAAYFIASQAHEVISQPSADVGSVGVVMAHTDWSKFNAKHGRKVTYITAGQYKAEGNSDEPLSDEALAHYKARVNEYYDSFVQAVARGRGTTRANVIDRFGKGRVFGAKAALAAGMVDRIDTLDNVVERLQSRKAASRKSPASQRHAIAHAPGVNRARAEIRRLLLH